MLNRETGTLNLEQLRQSAGGALQMFTVHYAPTVDSTMNLLPWFRERGIPTEPGLCLLAGQQTQGVGQHGAWISSSQDVKLSIVLPDVDSPRNHALLNCVAAFAVQRTLTHLARDLSINTDADPRFEVKLANDVLVFHQGAYRKISGSLAVGDHDPEMRTLLQTRDGFEFPQGCIVLGIGINITALPRPVLDPRFPPISLEELIGALVPREVAVGTLLRNLHELLPLARYQPQMLLHSLQEHLATNHGEVLIVNKDGSEALGRIANLTPSGLHYRSPEGAAHIPLEAIQRVVPSA